MDGKHTAGSTEPCRQPATAWTQGAGAHPARVGHPQWRTRHRRCSGAGSYRAILAECAKRCCTDRDTALGCAERHPRVAGALSACRPQRGERQARRCMDRGDGLRTAGKRSTRGHSRDADAGTPGVRKASAGLLRAPLSPCRLPHHWIYANGHRMAPVDSERNRCADRRHGVAS